MNVLDNVIIKKELPVDMGSGPYAQPFSSDPSELHIHWNNDHTIRRAGSLTAAP